MTKGAKKRPRTPNDAGRLDDTQDPLLAKLIELHGRATEIARRVLDDVRILADVQRDTSALLGQLWRRRSAPQPPVPVLHASALSPSAEPQSPRFLRFHDVSRRVGLSRSSLWRMERAGRFPQRHQLSANSVGWWEPDIDEWLANRQRR
jgi:predicted DNA-binding transcriptional regulator AlpA